jgi:hypothetical protein
MIFSCKLQLSLLALLLMSCHVKLVNKQFLDAVFQGNITPHIKKTEFNGCFIIHFKKKQIVLLARFYICFASFVL